MTDTPEALEARLQQLSRQNAVLKGVGLLLGGVVVGMLVAPHTQTPVAPPPVAVVATTAAAVAASPPAAPSPAVASATVAAEPPEPPAPVVSKPTLHIVLSPPAAGVNLLLDGHGGGFSTAEGLTLSVDPGRHRVEVKQPGFVVTRRDVVVGKAAMTVHLPALRLAHLELDTRPSGAHVHLDGPPHVAFNGVTPAHFQALRPGRYRVEVSRPGYESSVLIVRVTPGARLHRHADLAPIVAFQPRPVPPPYHPRIQGRPRYSSHAYYQTAPHHYTNRMPPPGPPRATPEPDDGAPPVVLPAPTGPSATPEE